MLVSDHPHLFETGGENYHTDFTAWDYVRGHEGDPWRTCPDPSWIGAPDRPAAPAQAGWLRHPYDDSRTWFRDEADYPGPRTMAAAADWLERQAPSAERYLLFVDEFDPHEPFDTPPPWAGALRPGRLAAPDLAAVRRRRHGPRDHLPRRARSGARRLRGQAVDDRPPPRTGARRARPPRCVGRHRGHPVHRPRALPRRARRRRQAGGAAVRADEPHPDARRLAGRRAGHGWTR